MVYGDAAWEGGLGEEPQHNNNKVLLVSGRRRGAEADGNTLGVVVVLHSVPLPVVATAS